jgi:type IV pilus assembly protein PilY1
MNTYTLGLGASGVMQFQEGYETDASKPAPATAGDFYSIWRGDMADPDHGVCAWQRAGTPCNWPRPKNNSQTNIDDLWHAAVNGRGIYFSAQNPESMAAGISAALQNVTVKAGSLAAVTTTGPRLEVGSAVFQVSFTSESWTGDVQRYALARDGESGALTLTEGWSARTGLSGVSPATRKIHYFAVGESGGLKDFKWDDLDTAAQDYFKLDYIKDLAQFCTTGTICLPPEARSDPELGRKLVDFLRGDRSNEGDVSDFSKYFRKRVSVLGDIVGSEATYVGKTPWSYTDNGYGNFRNKSKIEGGVADRVPMIYVGANDGMLHAFKAKTGEEAWAFVPSFLLPKLYRLAEKGYQHQFFVDGTPVMGDICVSGCAPGASHPEWKTILVGGLNSGGKGYYALDITDPENPKGLWEFTDANLGYTHGNPIITKLADGAGTWAVLVASGYNNVSPGDGEGHLFILDAATGALIRNISTGVGSTGTPSGLAKLSAFATYPEYNNTALRVYGGDLLGNLWRFDINDDVGATGYDAQLLVALKGRDKEGHVQPQPITSRPELGLINNRPVVFVGTGQMLGASDMGSRDTQSLYAILDPLQECTGACYADPRTLPTLFVKQEMTGGGTCPEANPYCPTGASMVTVTDNAVDWGSQNGWYVDFPGEGERVTTSMRLMQGTLAIITNTPQEGACVPVGISFAYFLDYRSGSFVTGTDGLAGHQLGNDLAAAGAYMQTDDGSVVGLVDRDCAGKDCISPTDPPFEPPAYKVRRISWRELIIE